MHKLGEEQGVIPFAVIARPRYRCAKGPDVHAMLMECYFDDSSDALREKYYACGGLMGNQEQWDLLDMLWSNETSALKEPFRATDCECGWGQFEPWPKPQRDKLMARLVDVIHSINLYGFASVVPIEAFKRVFPGLDETDAYALSVTQAIINMAHIADRGRHDAALWFELDSNKGMILKLYDAVKEMDWKPRHRLRSIHFEDKHLRPLQAADLIARESFKHMDNLGIRPTRIPVRQLSQTLIFMLWTEGALRHLAANGGPRNLKFLGSFENAPPGAKLKHFYKKTWGFHEQNSE